MKVIKLDNRHLEGFKEYCYKYRYEHDESFLDDEEINDFLISESNPTYLLIKDEKILGLISLMFDDYFLRGKKTRIRIFHCEESSIEAYQILLDAIHPIGFDINRIEAFLPNKLEHIQDIFKKLNFDYYRTSYIMIRKDKEKIQTKFPHGYELRALNISNQSKDYAQVRNLAFKNLKGSETPISCEDVEKHYKDKYLLKDGMQILWHEEKAVGIVRVLEEIDESGKYSFVAPIALIPDYQGKGLGKTLLKSAIEIGQENNLNDCMLVVNAENDKALSLYKSAGFEVDMAVSCFNLNLKK